MKPMELIEQGRFLGEEFLLWLWWRGLVYGGQSGIQDDTSACFVDDAVSLVSEHGDVKRLALSQGNPAESREAFEALSRGMRPSKAKIRLLSGDMEWTFTLDAAGLVPSSTKLPASQAKDLHGRLSDRTFLALELYAHLDRRFRQFLAERADEQVVGAMRSWIAQGMVYGPDTPDIPWEDVPAKATSGRDMTISVSTDGGKTFSEPIDAGDLRKAAAQIGAALVRDFPAPQEA